MTQAELDILLWMQEHLRTDLLDGLLKFISALGNGGVFWIVLTVLLLCFKKTRKAGVASAVALALMQIMGNMLIKPLVERARPCDVEQAVDMIIGRPHGYSFPSGHTASSFAVVFAFCFAGSFLWKPALVLAAPIAFSRMYLFVHYPTDILGGLMLGLVCGWLGAKIGRRLLYRFDLWNDARRARRAGAAA
ncbi:MAG: phosphatase PAP2 family protein [Eubacteriales bacterium]|nr:phosphatase PAP2 family protein [Eubacteriales bacterium]